MSCPVVKAIGGLYEGGYICSDDNDNAQIVSIGGDEVVLDDSSFLLTVRTLELARLELSKPDAAKLQKFYDAGYKHLGNATYKTIYSMYYRGNAHLYKMFIMLVNIVGTLEDTLCKYIKTDAKTALSTLSLMSLPSVTFLPEVDTWIMFDPRVLEHSVNKLVDYVNTFKVREKKITSLQHVKTFDERIDMNTKLPAVEPTIESMKEMLKHETIVANYVRALERYHVTVIGRMNEIFAACQELIDSLK